MSLAEFEDLVRRERESILASDYAAVAEIAARKSDLAARLGTHLGRDDVERLTAARRQAWENGQLLAAASRGIMTAITQIRDARALHDPRTYARDGQRTALGEGQRRLERRA